MTELRIVTSQPKSSNDIIYGYGQSSLGGFLAAIDNEGVCAILLVPGIGEACYGLPVICEARRAEAISRGNSFGLPRFARGSRLVVRRQRILGDDRAELLRDLEAAFPDSKLEPGEGSGPSSSVVDAVASLIEQPAAPLAYPTSIRGGDFEQMVYAALRQTRPGTKVTPAEVAIMIAGAAGSAAYVRAYASKDFLAVAVPFHRLQEPDGTSPAYRWGEERRQAFMKREAAIRRA